MNTKSKKPNIFTKIFFAFTLACTLLFFTACGPLPSSEVKSKLKERLPDCLDLVEFSMGKVQEQQQAMMHSYYSAPIHFKVKVNSVKTYILVRTEKSFRSSNNIIFIKECTPDQQIYEFEGKASVSSNSEIRKKEGIGIRLPNEFYNNKFGKVQKWYEEKDGIVLVVGSKEEIEYNSAKAASIATEKAKEEAAIKKIHDDFAKFLPGIWDYSDGVGIITMQFFDDGTCKILKNTGRGWNAGALTWKLSGAKLTFTDGGSANVYELKSIDAKNFLMKNYSFTWKGTRNEAAQKKMEEEQKVLNAERAKLQANIEKRLPGEWEWDEYASAPLIEGLSGIQKLSAIADFKANGLFDINLFYYDQVQKKKRLAATQSGTWKVEGDTLVQTINSRNYKNQKDEVYKYKFNVDVLVENFTASPIGSPKGSLKAGKKSKDK